jgi:hypothetical protein
MRGASGRLSGRVRRPIEPTRFSQLTPRATSIERTAPYIYSVDETLDIGEDNGTPIVEGRTDITGLVAAHGTHCGRYVGDVDIAHVEIGLGRKEKARDGAVGGRRQPILVGPRGRFKKL